LIKVHKIELKRYATKEQCLELKVFLMNKILYQCEIEKPKTQLDIAQEKIERLTRENKELKNSIRQAKSLLQYKDLRSDVNNLYHKLMDIRIGYDQE